MTFFYLFLDFLQIGLFATGGGLAVIPFLFKLTGKYDWLSAEGIGNTLAIAQSVPGAIGNNLAAYTGFSGAGIAGAFAASLGLAFPSIVIILVIARIIPVIEDSRALHAVFSGIRPAAAGLLAAAAFETLKIALSNPAAAFWYEYPRWREILLFAVVFAALVNFKKCPPIVFILLGGVCGVVLKL
jgi:chromate transporter